MTMQLSRPIERITVPLEENYMSYIVVAAFAVLACLLLYLLFLSFTLIQPFYKERDIDKPSKQEKLKQMPAPWRSTRWENILLYRI